MSFGSDSFDNSAIFSSNGEPMSITERLGYVKHLIFSKTRLEFRLLWNKIFQREDEELGWLLNPYRQSTSRGQEATMMASFNKNNTDGGYQYSYNDVGSAFGREKVTIYNRGIARKGDTNRRNRKEEKKSFSDNALEVARYMGMGVYMTSASFPSPFLPINDTAIYDETIYGSQNTYIMSKIW